MKSVQLSVAVLLLVLLASMGMAADKPVKVVVDGKPVTMTPPAIQHNNSTYIPLRAGTGAMGAHVTWNPNTQTATVTMCAQTAQIRASDGLMLNNTMYLPLRLLSTDLKCKVKWDETLNTVFITKPATGG